MVLAILGKMIFLTLLDDSGVSLSGFLGYPAYQLTSDDF